MKLNPNIVCRRILVPLDLSTSEENALNYAVEMARKLNGKIVLLHVIEPGYSDPEPALAYLPASTEIQERAGRKRLREVAQKLIPKPLFDKVILRLGSPYYEITAAAKELNTDLIVISTHGRTGLRHVLMGSTAERVVRHAHCPVLTVRMSETPVANPKVEPRTNQHRARTKTVLTRHHHGLPGHYRATRTALT